MKKAILPLLVVLMALVLTFVLVKSRKLPAPHETSYLGPLVEVMPIAKTRHQIIVTGTGTVQSRREVNITPQVKGRVVEIADELVAGGVFRKGELLLAIEAADYELAIALARSSLAAAELDLLRNQNLAELARKEWYALNSGSSTIEPDPLVVYEPQLKSARAQLEAASANVKQAELNLQRTRLFAPFDCYVRSEQVEMGQFLNAGSAVASLVGIDLMEVVVPLPLDELAWLRIPRGSVEQTGSKATIELQSGGRTFQWHGTISRALGEIDPHNRMARIVVTVAEPFKSGQGREALLLNDLLPGMFVEVRLLGEELADVFAVPRGALHDNDSLWVVDGENRLQIRAVEILRREREEVLIRSGVSADERIVLTNLSGAAQGMLLRPQLRKGD